MDLPTQRTITDEGYLIAPGNLARIGIQTYSAGELGIDSLPANKPIRLHRPAEEVFSQAAMTTFEDAPITVNHPPAGVNAENFRDLSVGHVRDVRRDGDHLAGKLIIRDLGAVKAVQEGKNQLSNGYQFDLDMTPGHTADGLPYDGVQRNIRGNHVAIVDYARGGERCRIADSQPKGHDNMSTQKVKMYDGFSIDLDAVIAPAVQDAVDRHMKALKDARDAYDGMKTTCDGHKARADEAEAKLAKLDADSKKKIGDAEAEIAKLKADAKTPDQINAIVEGLAQERAKVIGDAAEILGKDFDSKGKSVTQIRIAALDAVIANDEALKPIAAAALGGAEPAKAKEDVARLAFDAVVAARATRVNDQHADDGASSVNDAADAIADGHRQSGAPKRTADGKPKLVGRALMMHRAATGYYAKPESQQQ
jgi:hypothetical protein